LQLREKQASARDLLWIGNEIMKETDARHPLIVNDRVDVAMALNAKGVHLAYHSIGIAEAKRIMPSGMVAGASVHSLDEALYAQEAGADYLLFGHVYPSPSKPGLPPRGVDQLAEIVDRLTIPVIALGGIDLAKINEVLATGCAGIAMISAILSAENPSQALHAAVDAIARFPHPPKQRFACFENDP
jgi:thiamine-phosphate diphosphorylase